MVAAFSARVDLKPGDAEKELLALRSAYPDLVIQLVSMTVPLSERAVRMIGAQTLRARERGGLLASKPEVDLLLRLAGTNQITLALEAIGYKAEGTRLVVAAGDEDRLDDLRGLLAKNSAYSLRSPGDRSSEEDLSAVETAALLGARA